MIIQSYRIDGGREYHPRELKDLAKELGQRLELFSPYHQWQDGRSERAIRLIVERMRKVMIAMEIPSFLWPEIFLAIIYLVNRSATTTVENKTLLEEFFDQVDSDFKKRQVHRPEVSHLRTLGVKCYVLIPPKHSLRTQTANKLNAKAEVGILVGYNRDYIYRVYIPSRKRNKIARTSNVRFNEYGMITKDEDFDDEDNPKHEIPESRSGPTLVGGGNSDSPNNATVEGASDDLPDDEGSKRLMDLKLINTDNGFNNKLIIDGSE